MIFLKTFDQTPEYNDFILTEDYLLPNVSVCRDNQTKVYYNPWESYDYSQDYLTFEALESGTFKFTWKDNSNSIYYSLDDGSTWTQLTSGSSTPTINANDKVLFKGSNLSINSNYGIGTFHSTCNFNISGNIMSLKYGDNFISQTALSSYQFTRLFFNCTKLIDASNLILPATTLASNCYYQMFSGCTSLVTASELPATILAYSCYSNMFGSCTSLTTAPALPATTLAPYCYANMFQNCTSLTTAPELPATTLAAYCYRSMFYSCTSLTTAPSTLPATTLAEYCYQNMFQGCIALTTAPELPATTLVNYCYQYMFYSCSNLNYIKAMFTTIPNTYYTNNWVSGVATTGTFVKNSAATWTTTGNNGIPSGWTVETAAA